MKIKITMIIVTCEHAVNTVPEEYSELFKGSTELLNSHLAWDPGASELAGTISRLLDAPLYEGDITRLVVDLNRSPDSTEGLFSSITRKLPLDEREQIAARWYAPFRRPVEEAVRDCVARGEKVLHLSVHSFTPVFKGKERRCGIGLLYDTARNNERQFANEVRKLIRAEGKGFIVRMNYPYHGKTDGHAAWMRRHFGEEAYTGIEIEANQSLFREGDGNWEQLQEVVARSLKEAWENFG